MASFSTIGIIGRVRNPGVKETLKTLMDYLQSLGKKIYIDEETAAALDDTTLPTLPRGKLGKQSDLVVVVGGDGSLLNAAHTLVKDEVPVLGINRGSLGFLTDIHPTELVKIKAILDGNYILEERFLLTANIELDGQTLNPRFEHNCALNEFALIPGAVPHMIEFEVYIDDQFVCSQRSDGVIIATPTGSTAYALSAGGPILHPELNAIVIVPMFPHTLSVRPIVISGDKKVTLVVTPNNKASPRLACDGQTYLHASSGSHITITKNPEKLQLIHPRDHDYYETLRSKLHWGQKLQYSE
ncbi:MAG TPA: NAD(+) kinase [Gammaproteobacteria bacterium]|nr:NAD(+) kinase [Gammaproteobacteria bacterium]